MKFCKYLIEASSFFHQIRRTIQSYKLRNSLGNSGKKNKELNKTVQPRKKKREGREKERGRDREKTGRLLYGKMSKSKHM